MVTAKTGSARISRKMRARMAIFYGTALAGVVELSECVRNS